MAGRVYYKSFLWLVALGGVGYGLLELTTPSAEKISQVKAYSKSTTLSEEEKSKILFMRKLKQAATGEQTPVYIPKNNKDK